MNTITSTQNSLIKLIRSLSSKKGRRESGCIAVEGEVMIREALSCGLSPRYAISTKINETTDLLIQAGCDVSLVTENILVSACDTVTPQGIVAVFDLPVPTPASEMRGGIVVLDGVQDPGNCGTIWRTADAAGFGGILFGSSSCEPFSPKVMRSAMGSAFRVPFAEGDLSEILPSLRKRGYRIVASSLSGNDIYSAELPCPDMTLLIIGNEAHGISGAVQEMADHLVKLPMRGGAESLNASVAAGILMYEITRPGRA